MHHIQFSYAAFKKWHSQHQFSAAHLLWFLSSFNLTDVFGWHTQRGGGDYIILAVPLPERHALKWAMLVRQIQWTKCRERLEIRGRHRSKAVAVSFIITWCDVDWGEHWQIQKDNPFVCSFPMVKPAWQTRQLTVQGLGACLYQDSTIKSSTCLGCKQSICSNVWKHGCISKLKGHSII